LATLVTGGLGFIGAEVARVLAKTGETTVVFDIHDQKNLLKICKRR